MTTVVASAMPKSVSVEAVVIRCGCTEEQKRAPDWHGARSQVCPCPRKTEDLGRVAYWHRSLMRRLMWRVESFLRGRSAGRVRVTE